MRALRSFAFATAIGALALAFAAPAEAQVRFGVGGGPSFPVGDFGDFVQTGFHVQGNATLGIPLLPLGVRADIAYNRWNEEEHDDHHATMLSGTVNGVWTFGIGLVRGYGIAGLGVYRARFEDIDDETNVGLNIGAGGDFWLGPIRPFAELRFHHIFSDVENIQYIPLTLGVRF